MTDVTETPTEEVQPQPEFIGDDHHWLHVDPNGDHWLQHPTRRDDMGSVHCHHDLTQCPVHLHVAHRRITGPSLGIAWGKSQQVPGAPHHDVYFVADRSGDDTIGLVYTGDGMYINAGLHEPGYDHDDHMLSVADDGTLAISHPASCADTATCEAWAVCGMVPEQAGEYWFQTTPWMTSDDPDENAKVKQHFILSGQRQ